MDKKITLRSTKSHFLPLSISDRDKLLKVYGWGSIERDDYDTALFMASLQGFSLAVLL